MAQVGGRENRVSLLLLPRCPSGLAASTFSPLSDKEPDRPFQNSSCRYHPVPAQAKRNGRSSKACNGVGRHMNDKARRDFAQLECLAHVVDPPYTLAGSPGMEIQRAFQRPASSSGLMSACRYPSKRIWAPSDRQPRRERKINRCVFIRTVPVPGGH